MSPHVQGLVLMVLAPVAAASDAGLPAGTRLPTAVHFQIRYTGEIWALRTGGDSQRLWHADEGEIVTQIEESPDGRFVLVHIRSPSDGGMRMRYVVVESGGVALSPSEMLRQVGIDREAKRPLGWLSASRLVLRVELADGSERRIDMSKVVFAAVPPGRLR